MEIRIYDNKLNLIGIIENQTSLLWTRKYFEAGTFELHAPITSYNLAILKLGNLVTMHGRDDAGIIEDVHCEESNDKREITVQGRFLAAYMSYRLIVGTVNINSTVENAMRSLLTRCTEIPLVRLGQLHGFTPSVSGQVTNSNLLTFMKKLAMAGNIGYKFTPDFTAKTITFDTYVGEDHTVNQSEKSRVIFSENYYNLNRTEYQTDDAGYANVAYVYGKDASDKEVSVVVGNTSSSGLARREIYVDGTGVNASELSQSDFMAKLRQEGQNTINARAISESFECDTNPTGNYVYQKDYDLGDIVTVRKDGWNIQRDLRITEVMETYEHEIMTVTPTFGNPLPTSIDWEDNY